uniref:hypothetical protein n=1 Tax=Acetatifactor sp. TaxID=1872090 RepID=UPI004055F22B
MRKQKVERIYAVNLVLKKLPKVGDLFNDEIITKVKRCSYKEAFTAIYKITTRARHRKRRHYFIWCREVRDNIYFGNVG